MDYLQLLLKLTLGMGLLLGVAYLFSENKRQINWKLIGTTLALQFFLAFILLKVPFVYTLVAGVSNACVQTLSFTMEGSKFLFGNLVDSTQSWGFIFAFQVLPSILFFSALTTLLYHFGILQRVVYMVSWVLCKFLPLSGRESMAMIGNIFLGQSEAPLLIKPYVASMSRSELFCLMVGGMATIAGAVLIAYITILGGSSLEQQIIFGTHLLTASIISAPAAIMFSKLIVPETKEVSKELSLATEPVGINSMDALCNGTQTGLSMAFNIGAVLLVSIALIAMGNHILGFVGNLTGLNQLISTISDGVFSTLSFQSILGVSLRPVAWLIGIPWNEALFVGQLLGEKTIINEFVAYLSLAKMQSLGQLSHSSVIIATYALCGFTNLASIGIQITGISLLAPNQRPHLCSLGFKALLASSLACLSTAIVAAVLVNTTLSSSILPYVWLILIGLGLYIATVKAIKLLSTHKLLPKLSLK